MDGVTESDKESALICCKGTLVNLLDIRCWQFVAEQWPFIVVDMADDIDVDVDVDDDDDDDGDNDTVAVALGVRSRKQCIILFVAVAVAVAVAARLSFADVKFALAIMATRINLIKMEKQSTNVLPRAVNTVA
uniref:Uncharacterized protein n=1 Tax=Glossina pallidipes TaxID=7398 RepID=A0A1B0AK18_GLOPL